MSQPNPSDSKLKAKVDKDKKKLEEIIDKTPQIRPIADKLQSWISGIQAIFAGYIAASQQQLLSPNIIDFWKTKQYFMVRPSLVDIAKYSSGSVSVSVSDSSGGVGVADRGEGSKKGDEEDVLKLTLWKMLISPGNRYTKLTKTLNEESKEEDIQSLAQKEWELTPKGQLFFGSPTGLTQNLTTPMMATPSSSP